MLLIDVCKELRLIRRNMLAISNKDLRRVVLIARRMHRGAVFSRNEERQHVGKPAINCVLHVRGKLSEHDRAEVDDHIARHARTVDLDDAVPHDALTWCFNPAIEAPAAKRERIPFQRFLQDGKSLCGEKLRQLKLDLLLSRREKLSVGDEISLHGFPPNFRYDRSITFRAPRQAESPECAGNRSFGLLFTCDSGVYTI